MRRLLDSKRLRSTNLYHTSLTSLEACEMFRLKGGCQKAALAPLKMKQETPLIRAQLKTPRAAAVAGIIFSVLLIAELVVFQLLVRADPREAGAWLRTSSNEVALALNLVPFAGIAFLWFIGVLRDRLGDLEDQFFATVFLGSGLLFLALLFASAAVAGGIILTYATQPQGFVDSATFAFGRSLFHELINLYAVKMASVFMISTSVIGVRTRFTPRWSAYLGFACALLLLLSGRHTDWMFMVFPVWVLLTSIYILVENLGRPSQSRP